MANPETTIFSWPRLNRAQDVVVWAGLLISRLTQTIKAPILVGLGMITEKCEANWYFNSLTTGAPSNGEIRYGNNTIVIHKFDYDRYTRVPELSAAREIPFDVWIRDTNYGYCQFRVTQAFDQTSFMAWPGYIVSGDINAVARNTPVRVTIVGVG